MEELIAKITQLGINIDTQSLVEIAKYWFWQKIISDASLLLAFGGLGLGMYKVVKNYGTGKWK